MSLTENSTDISRSSSGDGPVHILLVEDDSSIAHNLKAGLELENYSLTHCSRAEDALPVLQEQEIDLLLLDVRLPGMDGFSFCRQLRDREFYLPIIMLTARDEELDKVLGLEMGADDYLVKPFGFRELLSRIRAQLRRTRSYDKLSGDIEPDSALRFGDVVIDTQALRCSKAERTVDLTPVEMRIMLLFAEHESQSLSRQQIIDRVWGVNYFLEDPRTVDVHIRHLREKLEDDPSSPRHIQTVRGHGYRFVKNP